MDLVKYSMGSAKIMHGETKTFSATLNQAGTITGLYPAPGTSEYCLGTLASKCAAYGRQTVVWNVSDGQVIKKTQLSFTVTVTISFEAWKGEYYGDQYGQPAPDMGLWFYPAFTFTPETKKLVISTTPGGTTVPTPGSYEYVTGSVVSGITAFPSSGYVFTRWLLDGVQYTSNPITVVMDTDHTLQAEFSGEPPPPPATYILNITATEGGVTVPGVGLYVYDAGNVVMVTAFPSEGYRFESWLLDGAARTENPLTVTMNQDHSLHAVFVEEAVPPPPPPDLAVPAACGLGAVALIAAVVGYSYLRGGLT